MRVPILLIIFPLVALMVDCRAQERVDPPEILGGSPIVIRSAFDRGIALDRDHPNSPWIALSSISDNMWVNLDNLCFKKDDGSADLRNFDNVPRVKVWDSTSQGEWRVEFKGQFIERDEHFGQGQGLIPSEVRTVHTRRFTGEIYFYLQGAPVMKQHLVETPLDVAYPFIFDYSESKGILAFHYTKGHWGTPDSCQLYFYKFTPTHPAVTTSPMNSQNNPPSLFPLMEVTITDRAKNGITKAPKKEKP